MEDEILQKLIGAGIAYVSIHPRSEKEIFAYITKRIKRFHLDECQYKNIVFDRLKELGYVNDENYARMFIASRMQSRPKGKKYIILELKRKGVSQEIIASITEEMFHEEGQTEIELARRVAHKKYSIWKKLPILEQKKKLFGLLQRRGFGSSVVHRVIDECMGFCVQSD